MKASEVLRRYAAGERDFRCANLRGQSFKGQDLSGADFSGADIRGTNFSNAILRKVNFTEATAGPQQKWVVSQLIVALAMAALAGLLSGFTGTLTAYFLVNQKYAVLLGIPTLITLAVLFVTVIRHGFVVETFGTLALSLGVTFFLAFALALAINGVAAGTFALVIISAIAGVVVAAFASVFAANSFGEIALIITVIFALAVVPGIVAAKVFVDLTTTATAFAIFIAAVILILGSYMALCTLKSSRKYLLIRRLSVAFNALDGTRFYKTDLTHANLTQVMLKGANFREANLTQVRWHNAQKLDRARLGNTYLANPKIRQLVVTLNGQDKNFDDLNLEGINLQGANLQDASFVGSNLNDANLQDANLSRAILKQTQLDGTDLTGAILTGAYIEDWGITGTTSLNGVQCEYVFMQVPTKENPNPLRKPDNLREMFADGEFADFIQPYVDTLDLYHSQNVDPRAISIAFKNLSQNYPEADLEIVAMERRGQNSFNLKVRTAPTANKSELSAEYFDDYNRLKTLPEARLLLLEKDDRIRNLEQMINTALNQPNFNIHNVQGDVMSEQNRNINVGRDLTLSGSTLNLGEISGTVTNAINQLPDRPDPDQPSLKHLLRELKEAIETDSDQPDTDKADLLEQVQNLAEAKQTEELAKKEGLVRKAKKIFEATLKVLSQEILGL